MGGAPSHLADLGPGPRLRGGGDAPGILRRPGHAPIGQELVEVVVQTDAPSTAAEKAPAAESPEEPSANAPLPADKPKLESKLKLELANLADRYSLESGTDRTELEDEWRELIERIAGLRTARCQEFLTDVVAMVEPTMPTGRHRLRGEPLG